MPKEQIINDEVDVSKCRFYKEGLCCLSYAFVENGYDCVECSEYNDCDYKQLQRKTKECEELKAQLNDMACMDDDNVLCYPKQELKKECEKYEQALIDIQQHFEHRCKQCREEYELYASCDVCWKKQILNIFSKAKDGE